MIIIIEMESSVVAGARTLSKPGQGPNHITKHRPQPTCRVAGFLAAEVKCALPRHWALAC